MVFSTKERCPYKMVVETVNLMESPNETANVNIKSLKKSTKNLKANPSPRLEKKDTSLCGPLCSLEEHNDYDDADLSNILEECIPNEDDFQKALLYFNYSFDFKK